MRTLFRWMVSFGSAGIVLSSLVVAADPSNSARNVNVVPFVYFTQPYNQPGYSPYAPSYSYRRYYNPYYNPNFASPYLQSQSYRSYRDSPSAAPDYYMYYRDALNSGSSSNSGSPNQRP